MAKYSIEDTSLIAIGDAIRSKTGIYTIDEEKTITLPASVISKTPNAINETEWDGEMPKAVYRDVIKVYDATEMRAVISFHAPRYSRISLYNAPIYTDADRDKEGVYPSIITSTGTATSVTIGAGFNNPIIGGAVTLEFTPYVGAEGFDYLGYYAEITYIDASRNPLGEREYSYIEEVPNTMTPARMAEEINALTVADIPSEAFEITGSCQYRFAYNGWDWFIDKFGNQITTENIEDCTNMFTSTKVKIIPFDINLNVENTSVELDYMFYLSSITAVPTITGKPYTMGNIFNGCRYLRELSEESVASIDWTLMDTATSQYAASRSNTFTGCSSLRKFPLSFFAHGNPKPTTGYSIYSGTFNGAMALDEVINFPLIHTEATWTTNSFGSFLERAGRVARFTFEDTNKEVQWTKQTIDLSSRTGWLTSADSRSYITSYSDYNGGITADFEVKDDATYQALKNTENWYATSEKYSRYNHDSAVETINSLPVAPKGGNTIKFKGAAGELTDGGAINTLTEEEIAVAAAKGWTITLS